MAEQRYTDRTKEELQRELRRRDQPVSGSKSELVERLRRADRQDSESSERTQVGDGGDADATSSNDNGRIGGMDAARAASEQFQQLSGRTPESVSGLTRRDDGWQVSVEVVELERVPHTTDVLSTYEVTVDHHGQLAGCERRGRFIRSAVSED